MTDLLADIKKYLVAGGIKSDLVALDAIPDTPDEAVAIYEYQGNSPLAQISGVSRPIQIVTRDIVSTKARTQARTIYGLLKTEDSLINFTTERWAALHLRQPPFKFKTDEAGRSYYAFNMQVTTYED